MLPLSVVTLNWNLKDETIACTESVLATGLARERMVIVDNGSSDDSVQAISAHFDHSLPLIRNPRNLGFAGGMNAGIQYALEQGAASVLLLNNDTVIAPTMIQVLLEAANELHDSPSILGPAIYYYDNPEQLWRLGDVRHRFLPMPRTVKSDAILASDSKPFQVDYVTGCAMLIRREVFECIGLLDQRYFMYFEDADFCRRARDADFSVWCVPKAKMWHKVSLSSQRDRPFNRYHRALNQVRFYHEHSHGPSVILREGYIAVKLIKTVLEDLWRGDWTLIGPTLRGTLIGYQEQLKRADHEKS